MARLNIERYRRLLATETRVEKRRVLQTLLAEEEAKLADHVPIQRNRTR